MCKTAVIGSVVCVLVWAVVCVAVDKAPPEMEGREPPRELVEVRNRIEKLRVMAREAEEKAGRLWAEAEELERELDRGFERRVEPERMEEMHAMLAELKEGAARAKREGRHDEAAELHEEARRIAEEIEARVERGKEWVPPELVQRIEELRHMARQAEERGEIEKARGLWAEAKELERNLDRRFEGRPKPEQMGEMRARLAELKEGAARAKREGRHDEAAELHEEARRIAEEIEVRVERGKEWVPPELAQRVEELRHMAREAKERGDAEKAGRLWAEAEELERELGHGFKRKVPGGGPERVEEMHRRLAELKEAAERAEREGRRDEAARLGEEAHKLAIQLEKAAHREKMTDVGREIERLHVMAAKAKEAGQHEKAEVILREAKGLERREKDRVERPKEGPPVKELMHQIEMLREEVGRLQREVEQLKRERPDRDRPRDRDRSPDRERLRDRDRPRDPDRPQDRDRPRDRDR